MEDALVTKTFGADGSSEMEIPRYGGYTAGARIVNWIS